MRKHPVLVGVLAVLLLGGGALVAILLAGDGEWLAWRPWSSTERAQAGGPALPTVDQRELTPVPSGVPERPSPTTPRPAPEGYKPFDPPVIVAAPPKPLPKKKEERQQAVLDERKDKFAAAMDALNRRAAAKVGNSNPIPPAAPAAPAAYNSRRGVLSAAEPVRKPEASPP